MTPSFTKISGEQDLISSALRTPNRLQAPGLSAKMKGIEERRMSMDLSGRTALITGAGQGIGRACAEIFAERGAYVVLLDKNKKTLPEVADRLAGKGAGVTARIVDLTRTEALRVLIEGIKKETPIDILVNNAGFDRPGVTSKTGTRDFNAVMGIHVLVPFLLTRMLLPDMRNAKWGRIINISSIYGLLGAKGEVAYATAKAAIVGLTKTTAREGGPDGVTVNAIAPGLIRTPPIIAMPDKYKAPILAETLLGRIGEPEDIARVAAFLASEDAAFITGAVIPVSGGWNI
jgi:3-oxoacyl-[acyl-carrier protein] reductase